MTATIIDGKSIAADLRAAVKMETAHLRAAHGIVPGLAVVLLGDDPASQSYVASKSRAVAEVGMRPFDHHLPAGVTEAELLSLVQKLNADPAVHGILVQMPLPPEIDAKLVVAAVDPAKDVDGFTRSMLGGWSPACRRWRRARRLPASSCSRRLALGTHIDR